MDDVVKVYVSNRFVSDARLARRGKSKQKAFLAETEVVPCDMISGLDLPANG